MIYNKAFSREDLKFFLNTFDVSEAFFSFITEEGEPEIVDVAKTLDPSLMIFAAIVPSISKDNLILGLQTLMKESGEIVGMLEPNYRTFNFGRPDLKNEPVLKQFVERYPLSEISLRILTLGRFDEDFLLSSAELYREMFARQKIREGLIGLVRLSFNSSFTVEGRERFYQILESIDLDMESVIFNNSLEDEEEFLKFYERIPAHQRPESLCNSACPEYIIDQYLADGEWESLEKLALSSKMTDKQHGRFADLILNFLAADPGTENEKKSFLRTAENFIDNPTVPIILFRRLVEDENILESKELHSHVLTSIGSRIHEDLELYNVAQNIMNSYNLSPHETTETLRSLASDKPEVPEELHTHVNNIISFYYSLLRNIQTPAEVLDTVNTQNSVANEAISLTMLPHPNLGELQAATILDKTIGSPFEQITLLHLRNAEVMRVVEHRYDELSHRSKLAILLNPKVHGETYLALALQEEDKFIRELIMRAGAEAHIRNTIGGLFLTELSMDSMLEAWKGLGGDPSRTRTLYADFNVNA